MNLIKTQADLDLEYAKKNLQSLLKEVERWFPECNITLLIRHKDSYEKGMMFTKDKPREIINAVRHFGKRIGIKE